MSPRHTHDLVLAEKHLAQWLTLICTASSHRSAFLREMQASYKQKQIKIMFVFMHCVFFINNSHNVLILSIPGISMNLILCKAKALTSVPGIHHESNCM